ncbi:FtsL-like putative cell division protein [Chitinophaga varians]|uniref:FtsL-like putative cell division protein n=1 Tax=Chitinophaga varians TaxID=2202339 RepID=UPI00293BFB85|nr:FtsL-like putative cell division protein [Chitinophaga varians]
MLQEEVIETNQEEPTGTESSPVKAPKREWRLRINYRALVQNLPYIGFLAVLALIYIANSHLAEKKIRRINQLGKEIKELKWEYINVKSELMFRSKMSEVSKSVEQLGLKQLSSPPQKIVLKKENEQ